MIKERFPGGRKGRKEKIYFISLMRLTTNGKTEGKMEKNGGKREKGGEGGKKERRRENGRKRKEDDETVEKREKMMSRWRKERR